MYAECFNYYSIFLIIFLIRIFSNCLTNKTYDDKIILLCNEQIMRQIMKNYATNYNEMQRFTNIIICTTLVSQSERPTTLQGQRMSRYLYSAIIDLIALNTEQ